MAMSKIWTFMLLVSLLFSLLSGQTQQLGAAVLEGASSAVDLCLTMAAAICLWSGVMRVMSDSGISSRLARWMLPVLRKLFPNSCEDTEIMENISGNVSANLLGLGNAATPLGMKACTLMSRYSQPGIASDDMCTLVILNAASIQLIPTSLAALRTSAGSSSHLDVLPAIWICSIASVGMGLLAAKLLRKLWRKQ